MDFAFKLPRNQKKCFYEVLSAGTLVRAAVISEEPAYQDLSVNVINADGKPFFPEHSTGSHIKLSFTTVLEGDVSICVHNNGKKYIKIFFEFMTGIDAGDLSVAASDLDLKPVEKNINSLDRLLQSLQGTTSLLVRKEEDKITQTNSIPKKLYFFSAVTIIVLVVVAFTQVKFLERQLRAKKLI